MSEQLLVGVARADITPAPGIHMGGYWGRKSGATDVHDPLMAKMLTFELGTTRAALVALDLVGLDAATVASVRRRIEKGVGIPGEGIMICCSHTHAGPLTAPFRGMGEIDETYLAEVEETVVRLAEEGMAAPQPARVAHARVEARLGINRREARQTGVEIGHNPDGPVVSYAHLVRFEGEEGLLATLFSHACHGVVLGGANHSISADFPGAAARFVERETGAPALFVNGACGDINPRKTGGSFEDVEELGRELGQAIVDGLDGVSAVKITSLRHALEEVQLPLCEPPSRLQAEVEKLALQLKAELKKIASDGGDIWAQRVPQAHLEWAQATLDWVKKGEDRERSQRFEIQVLALGGLALLGMEGEIFSRYQLELEEESPLPATLLCGYANGCVGYVPTADEYARGGYEVDSAYKVYPSVQMIAPESEELIRRAARSLLGSVAA